MLALMLALPLTADASNVEDSLVVGIQSSKTASLRPLEPVERDFMSIYSLVYESLMVIDDDYKPDYGLAESYTVSPNGKTWTFKLRENLKFSNGQKLTANDVAATAQWIIAKATQENTTDPGYYANLRYFIKSISAKDERTVEIKAERAYYGFLYAMTFPVLPASQLEMDNPCGSGPYMVDSFNPGAQLYLTVNPHWWKTPPQVKNIVFEMHEKPAEVIESYEYARVDTVFTRSIASAQYKGGTSSLALDYRTNQLECLLMNNDAFPLNNRNIREAIRCLIDTNRIASSIYNGMVARTDTPFINGTWLYNSGLGSYFRYDPARAIELLEAEGWYDTNDDGVLDRVDDDGESVPLEIDLCVYEEPDNDVRVETANYIRDALGDYGIKVNVVTISFTQAQTRLNTDRSNFDMCLAAYAMDTCPDPGFMLMKYKAENYCRYRSNDMTNLCNELRTAMDDTTYQSVAMKIQEQFAKDCPFICLFYRSGTVLTRRMYTVCRDVRELELLKGIESFHN